MVAPPIELSFVANTAAQHDFTLSLCALQPEIRSIYVGILRYVNRHNSLSNSIHNTYVETFLSDAASKKTFKHDCSTEDFDLFHILLLFKQSLH